MRPGRDDTDQVIIAARVRIDIGLNVDPLAPRLVDQCDDLVHAMPERLVGDLDVDDVDGNAGASADLDRLLVGREDLRSLVSDMRRIEAPVPLDHRGEGDDVIGGHGEFARAGEHGGQPDRPVAHRFVQ